MPPGRVRDQWDKAFGRRSPAAPAPIRRARPRNPCQPLYSHPGLSVTKLAVGTSMLLGDRRLCDQATPGRQHQQSDWPQRGRLDLARARQPTRLTIEEAVTGWDVPKIPWHLALGPTRSVLVKPLPTFLKPKSLSWRTMNDRNLLGTSSAPGVYR